MDAEFPPEGKYVFRAASAAASKRECQTAAAAGNNARREMEELRALFLFFFLFPTFFSLLFLKNIYISFSNCPYRDTQENRLFSLAAVIAQLSGASCSTYKSLACPLVGRSHFFKHHLSIVFLSTLFHRTRRMAL